MNRQELKSKIPHGYSRKIAEKAGVTHSAVSHFLNGKSNNINIEMAALEILADLSDRKKELIEKIA